VRYKVREGCRVLWPDGSVRAESGQVFDGEDGRKDKDAARARVMLRGQAHLFDPIGYETREMRPAKKATKKKS